ncbi:MAG: hypothetical protein K2K45_00500 [Muribaculaceae bacterium]|nr:hypothetical protein [Muribaculaceae bacterium]
MIETSLIRLEDAVQNGQTLSAGSKVILPIGEEAEIYGFISTVYNMFGTGIDMPPLGECQVFSNRVIFYLDKQLHSFPILTSVCKASEKRYGVYLLYNPRYLNLPPSDWSRKYYEYTMCRENPHPKAFKIEGVKIEDSVAYYYPNDYDLYFESRSKFRAIGSGFVVITRRVSKPSENIKYEIFDSHSVLIERNQEG